MQAICQSCIKAAPLKKEVYYCRYCGARYPDIVSALFLSSENYKIQLRRASNRSAKVIASISIIGSMLAGIFNVYHLIFAIGILLVIVVTILTIGILDKRLKTKHFPELETHLKEEKIVKY